ncbi:unnamed protein product [Rotaria sordida]|uniref:Uncharacterized protein n=1 Tax=Rotaria sordida TaxID=392033 RepID=A0A815F8N1_9BILA|nr:unnamed protein product [Rotaria sordida]
MNSSDHHLDLITSARSSPPHQTLFSTSSTHKRLPSPTSSSRILILLFSLIGSRSPQRYFRLRDRFIRSYDQIELADQYQRAQEVLPDFEDILIQINELAHLLVDNLNNDPVVVEDVEQAAERFTTLDDLLPRTVYSKADGHRDQVQRLDEFQTLFKSTMDLDDQFSDDTNERLLIDHRLQSIKENFQFLFPRKNREHREIKTNFIQAEDIKHALLDINLKLDHLESLTH